MDSPEQHRVGCCDFITPHSCESCVVPGSPPFTMYSNYLGNSTCAELGNNTSYRLELLLSGSFPYPPTKAHKNLTFTSVLVNFSWDMMGFNTKFFTCLLLLLVTLLKKILEIPKIT